MIRKLQRMRSKKGFTLVELLVVIAIIGILAAILVPLMSNYLDSAKVTSANATAKSAKDNMTYWLQQEGNKNRGLKAGDFERIVVKGDPSTKGTFTATVGTEGVWNGYTDHDALQDSIGDMFGETFPEAANCTFVLFVKSGYCENVAYLPNGASPDSSFINASYADTPFQHIKDGKVTGAYGGIIVGTNPVYSD